MGKDSTSNKLHKGISEQNKSTRAYCLQQAKKLKREMRSLMKRRMALLEDIAKEQGKRPLTISEGEKAAIIILEKDLYEEKEVQKAVDYLKSNPDSLGNLKTLSESDVFRIGMIVKSSPGTTPKETDKIKAELLEAKKTVPHRTALALTMKPLYYRAKKAGVLDEIFPKRERRKMGELKEIAETFNDREKLRKIVEERGIKTVADFIRKLDYGADVYQHSKEVRKLLSSVLKEVKSASEKKEKCPEPGPPSAVLTIEDIVKSALTVLDCCTEENMKKAVDFIGNSGGEFDLSTQEGIQKIENMVLEIMGKRSAKKAAPGETVPLHYVLTRIKETRGIEPFAEKGFMVGGAYIESIMKREKMDEGAVKGYLYSIIHGFKLGTAKAAIGTNSFPERHVIANIKNICGSCLNGNVRKPSKIVKFLLSRGIASRPKNGSVIALENKIEEININWRPVIRVLFEQHKEILSR